QGDRTAGVICSGAVAAGGRPDISQLVACATAMARAMGQPAPGDEDARTFLSELLYKRQEGSGKDAWACIELRLITEIEGRNLVVAHCATWRSRLNGCVEPSCERSSPTSWTPASSKPCLAAVPCRCRRSTARIGTTGVSRHLGRSRRSIRGPRVH